MFAFLQIGDWLGVDRLLRAYPQDDAAQAEAWRRLGEHYMDRFQWRKAAAYFTQVCYLLLILCVCGAALRLDARSLPPKPQVLLQLLLH